MAKILVIDDDGIQRRILDKALTLAHHDVIEAKDGKEGVRRFRAEQPDLVVCDIVMPNQEGIETICEMRESAPDIPIIAISGVGTGVGLSYLDIAQKLGATSGLAKPFRPAELVALVNRLLGATGE